MAKNKANQVEENTDRPTSDEVRSEVFVEKYLTCWNATQAAREAGYKNPNKIGPRKLVEVGIQQAITERLKDLQAESKEVITRLTQHSRASIELFLDDNNELDLAVARKNNALSLVKKIKRTRRTEPRKDQGPVVITTLEIELHDAQAATVQLGRVHGIFVDKVVVEPSKALQEALEKLGLTYDDIKSDPLAVSLFAQAGVRVDVGTQATGRDSGE